MKKYLQGWDLMRILRLVMGVAIVLQSIHLKEYAMGFIGAWFAIMAIANIGCCGVGGCNTNYYSGKKDLPKKETEYEEIV